MSQYVYYQNNNFLESLKKLSYQNMIYMNDLGKKIYKMDSKFAENYHRKFYHMK